MNCAATPPSAAITAAESAATTLKCNFTNSKPGNSRRARLVDYRELRDRVL